MNSFLSISENVFFQPQSNYFIEQEKPIILCDFDGTISRKDVTDILLSHFGNDECDQLEQQWLNGSIGSRECMSKQIALMDASLNEIDEVLAQVQIDESFISFVQMAQRENINVHVVSDGLDYAIHSVLNRNGINSLPVFANRLLHDNDRSWRLEFPYQNSNCIKASGNCKCNHLKEQRQFFNTVYYVGDGASDFCVSNRVDLVFAKDKLISYCQERGIKYHAIKSFADLQFIFDHSLKTVYPQ